MSARRRRYRRRGGASLNMTPMVDVVLVILIFFMGAMGLAAAEQALTTGTPPPEEQSGDAGGSESSPQPSAQAPAERAVLRLTRAGNRTVVTGLGMTGVPIGDVAARLRAMGDAGIGAGVIVVVAPARDVPWQDVVLVHDAAEQAGISNVRLGVSSEAG